MLLTRAVESKPDHTTLLLQLAQFESGNGRFGDAERHLREVLRREPDSAEARLELGKALFQLGDVRGALEQNQLILKQRPFHSGALYNLGAIYANIGNTSRASEYWSRLLALDPHSENGILAGRMLSQLKTGKH